MTFPDVHLTSAWLANPNSKQTSFEVGSVPEGDATKLECCSRCNSASTTGYRLPELLEFFNRMSIAGLDRLITGLPIQ